MTISRLSTVTMLSPNHYNGRSARVQKVTIHHMAGNLSVEGCGRVFSTPARNASSNYGIGPDGRIGCYVDEDNAAWTSSSYWNDNQAITIEVANSYEGVASGTWAITEASYKALIALCADICNRYHIVPVYDGTIYASFTEHRMFAATGCPGPWIHDRMSQIVRDVAKAMEGDIVTNEDIQKIADAVWARYLGGVRAIDRLQGIDIYMPDRIWDVKLKAQGGKNPNKFKAQEYLTNVDDRVAKLAGRVDSLEAKIDKILKAVTK